MYSLHYTSYSSIYGWSINWSRNVIITIKVTLFLFIYYDRNIRYRVCLSNTFYFSQHIIQMSRGTPRSNGFKLPNGFVAWSEGLQFAKKKKSSPGRLLELLFVEVIGVFIFLTKRLKKKNTLEIFFIDLFSYISYYCYLYSCYVIWSV